MIHSHSLPLVFVHGWGGCPTLWSRIILHLQRQDPRFLQREIYQIDLGFFNSHDVFSQKQFQILPCEPFIGIGHSLGVLWLLKYARQYLKGLVAISGTTDFPSDYKPVVEKLIRGLEKSPLKTMDIFYGSGLGRFKERKNKLLQGDISSANNMSVLNLQQGLDFLINEKQNRHFNYPVLQIHANADKIIPFHSFKNDFLQGATGELWTEKLINTDSHFLPLTHPVFCAKSIQEFLRL